jgi:hypothetical protein
MRNIPFRIKKIIKSRYRMDRCPTTREAREQIESLIRKTKKGNLDMVDEQLSSELQGIAPLTELSKLLSF